MKKLVKKESKVDQFIDDIYKQTFSDDEKQNKREIDFLKEELGVGYSEDKIKSLFLRATTKFYLKVLDKKGFGQEVFSKEFASSEGIPIDDAITLYTVVAMKFASRISGNETSGSDF